MEVATGPQVVPSAEPTPGRARTAPVIEPGGGVLVCGLGRLGQHCVAILKAFGVPVHGIDIRRHDIWEVPELPHLLDSFTAGDCRLADTLDAAHIAECRAVLLVTSDERVNIAAAFAARERCPTIAIVARSSQENLNQLLRRHLGNFVAFEPTVLSAPAFALSALGGETVGLFHLEDQLIRVFSQPITADHAWRGRQPDELNTKARRVLTRGAGTDHAPERFHEWEAEAPLRIGDTVTWIELAEDRGHARTPFREREGESVAKPLAQAFRQLFSPGAWEKAWQRFWHQSSQMTRVALGSAVVISGLYLLGAVLYKLEYPEITGRDAANVAMVLILGGFDNLFGQLRLPFAIPLWLHIFSVILNVSGTVGVGILYAFLTERILSVRLSSLLRAPRIPREDHVILIGLGPLGMQITRLLLRWKRSFLVISEVPPEPKIPASVPVIVGTIREALLRANLATAASVVALTDDDVTNLEIALTARADNTAAALVIRADDTRFSRNVAALVPGARPLGVHALAAEAFVAAAFGESVHQLLHIKGQTVLVTEYAVERGDTLVSRLVGEVAYGYGVIALLLQRSDRGSAEFFPSDDTRLHEGDRFVVLATIDSLRNIEHGRTRAPSCFLEVDSALTSEGRFEGARTIARVSGCEVGVAQETMGHLPGTLGVPLFDHQARRLVRELGRVGVKARLAPQRGADSAVE